MFIQRTIISLLFPYVYRFVSFASASRIHTHIARFLITTSFTGLLGTFWGIIRMTLSGAPIQIQTLPNLLHAVSHNNIIPVNIRNKVMFVSLILGILGRIALIMSWSIMIPIISGCLYIWLKSANYSVEYLVKAYDLLPLTVKNWFVYVQSFVYGSLSSIYSDTKGPITKTAIILAIFKTITYFDSWELIVNHVLYIPAFFWTGLIYLNKLWIVKKIYDNPFINYLLTKLFEPIINPLCIKIYEWIWIGIAYAVVNTPIGAILKYVFIDRDFFLIEWTKKLFRFIKSWWSR